MIVLFLQFEHDPISFMCYGCIKGFDEVKQVLMKLSTKQLLDQINQSPDQLLQSKKTSELLRCTVFDFSTSSFLRFSLLFCTLLSSLFFVWLWWGRHCIFIVIVNFGWNKSKNLINLFKDPLSVVNQIKQARKIFVISYHIHSLKFSDYRLANFHWYCPREISIPSIFERMILQGLKTKELNAVK